MKLLTKEIKKELKKHPLGSTENLGDKATAIIKYFSLSSKATWYVLESEKIDDDYLFFGYIVSPISSDFNELGYFRLSEFEQLNKKYKGEIERDLYFTPKTLDAIKQSRFFS